MPKKIFSIIFCIFLCVICFFSPISASAYEVTGFDITAKAGLLISLDTDRVLYEKNIDDKVYPASITKIMTAVLILESEKYDPDAKITMTRSALDLVLGTGLAVSHLKENEEFTQYDLVHLVLISSCGDVAYLASEYYGGSVENFVGMMNTKAQELGLTGTHYSNPVGLHDEENYTTVRDICTLARYALNNETFKEVCQKARYSMPATNFSGARTLSTTIFLQDNTTNYYYQYAKGIKTGFTNQAGRCVVSTASYNGYNYLCILMGCPSNAGKRLEFIESANLYRWAFNNFSFKEIANSTEPVCEIPLELSFETDFAPLYFKEPFVTVLPKDADDSTIVIKPTLNSESVDAPLKKGQVLGTADVIYAEEVIGTVDLVVGEDIKASAILVFVDRLKSVFSSIYMKIVYAAIAIGIIIFILLCIKLNINNIKKRKVKYIPYKENTKGKHK